MHKQVLSATVLAIAIVNEVLAATERGDISEHELKRHPTVEIDNLVVPEYVTVGSADAILDCDFHGYDGDLDEKEGLVVKWWYDNPNEKTDIPRKNHLVYQWIPPQKPQALGLLKNKVDLTYKASSDPFTEHRAMRILSPKLAMSGVYTCVVSTFYSEDERRKTMTVRQAVHTSALP